MTPEEEAAAETAMLEAVEYGIVANMEQYWEATRKMQRHFTLLDIQDQVSRFHFLNKVRDFIVNTYPLFDRFFSLYLLCSESFRIAEFSVELRLLEIRLGGVIQYVVHMCVNCKVQLF